MIDTGAATSLGDYDTFSNLYKIQKLAKPIQLTSLGGSSILTEEVISTLPVEFNLPEKTMSIKLTNLKNKGFKCIIGNNILMPLKASINYRTEQLTLHNVLIPFYKETNEFEIEYEEVHNLEKCEVRFENLQSHILNENEAKELKRFYYKHRDSFYQDGQILTATPIIKHTIRTSTDRPIYSKLYKYPQIHESEIGRQINEMLDQGIIRASKSPYNSPLWIVKKKSDNSNREKWRIVIDYRGLNNVTIDDKFPIPDISSIFDKLGRAQYFSVIDLAKGFHQILMNEKDIEKTAFSTPFGHYEYIRMPFGLKNAPSTFQRMMNFVLKQHINKICVIYMDDILVFSTSIEEHFDNLNKVFNKLNEYGLKVQFDKCKFLAQQVEFLGHIITKEGIKPDPDKINAINGVSLPSTVKQIKSFLGLTGYYRKFIKNYSLIASPIIKYLRKDMKIDIKDSKYIDAFKKLKELITTYPILAFPDFDKKFVITTDASNSALGAVLSQDNKPICYASRTLNNHERNYSTIEKEMLAIIWALKYFRRYVYGRKFLVQTDHQPLKWLYSMKEPNSKMARWRIQLSEYDFDIDYVKGKNNKVADFLSRIHQIDDSDEHHVFQVEGDEMETVHSGEEDLNDHFKISEGIVNKYRTQIRILKTKNRTKEKIFDKYLILFIEESDLLCENYLENLFRENINKGTVGIYCELDDSKYNIIQQKLIQIFNNDRKVKFTKCRLLAVDLVEGNQLYDVIKKTHEETNHRGIVENFEELKDMYFCPNLVKHINKYVNNCRICIEAKYDRNPIKKHFSNTETPSKPNQIVHMDIFHVEKQYFLTTIDRFTKLGSAHRLSDKNMITIKIKLQERIALLGKPELLVMDNEFDNHLIEIFCRENNIKTHFTTPYSHTGNSDIERLHSTMLEHIRIIKIREERIDTEELVIRAIGYYNNTIHSTTKQKPMDFINRLNLNFKVVSDRMDKKKRHLIGKININRKHIPAVNPENMFMKNPKAERQKTAKRYTKHNRNNPNKIDIARVKRPLKSFS